MFCGQCGTQSQPGSQFCGKCGARSQAPATNQSFTSSTSTQFGQFGGQQSQPFSSSTMSDAPAQKGANGMAVAGLILAFFSPLFGIIFSSMGLSKAKQLNGKGRGIAIAGIVVSILNFVLTILLYPFIIEWLEGFLE